MGYSHGAVSTKLELLFKTGAAAAGDEAETAKIVLSPVAVVIKIISHQ